MPFGPPDKAGGLRTQLCLSKKRKLLYRLVKRTMKITNTDKTIKRAHERHGVQHNKWQWMVSKVKLFSKKFCHVGIFSWTKTVEHTDRTQNVMQWKSRKKWKPTNNNRDLRVVQQEKRTKQVKIISRPEQTEWEIIAAEKVVGPVRTCIRRTRYLEELQSKCRCSVRIRKKLVTRY